jgi:hypothetical protein
VTQYDQGQQAAILYAEKGSALRWPYYFHLVLWGVVLAASIAAAAVTDDPNWSFPITIGFIGEIFTGAIFGMNFRTGE